MAGFTLLQGDFEKIERSCNAALQKWRDGITHANKEEAKRGIEELKKETQRLIRFTGFHKAFLRALDDYISNADEFVLESIGVPKESGVKSAVSVSVNIHLGGAEAGATNLLKALSNEVHPDINGLDSAIWKRFEHAVDKSIREDILKVEEEAAEYATEVQALIKHVNELKNPPPPLKKALGDLKKLKDELGKLR